MYSRYKGLGVRPARHRLLGTDRDNVLREHRSPLSGTFGDLDQLAYRRDEFVAVLEGGCTPFFSDVMLATDWNRFSSHQCEYSQNLLSGRAALHGS